MTSAKQSLTLSFVALLGLLATAGVALAMNRLEPAALGLGAVLGAGGSWCLARWRDNGRPSLRAGAFCLAALGALIFVAALADLFDIADPERGVDAAVGACIGAVASALAASWFAARLFSTGPRVALSLVCGWALFAHLIVMRAAPMIDLPSWQDMLLIASVQVPAAVWMLAQAKSNAGVFRMSRFQMALLLGVIAVVAMGLETDNSDQWTLQFLGCAWLCVLIVTLVWTFGRWSLRAGCAQPGVLFAIAAVTLLMSMALDTSGGREQDASTGLWEWIVLGALPTLFVGWAAWRYATRRRATRFSIALFAATTVLIAIQEEEGSLLYYGALAAAVIATGVLCLRSVRTGARSSAFARESARSIRQARHAAMAMGLAGVFLTSHALIDWLGENASPSRAMAQMGLPTQWVAVQALRDEFLWPRSARLSWLSPRDPDMLVYENLSGTPDWWSYVAAAGEREAFDSGTQLSTNVDWVETRGRLFAGYVEGGSFADAAGIRRGFELVKLRCAHASEKFLPAMRRLSERCKGNALEGVFRDEIGRERPITWRMSRKPGSDVSHTVLETDRGPVGYSIVRAFRYKDLDRLREATTAFEQAGVRELVIDLRYNGGGKLWVMNELANLLVGARFDRQVLLRESANRFNPDRRHEWRFANRGKDLPLERIAFLTGAHTCSASESLIQGLRPYVQAVVIGEGTCGKPVGFEPIATVDSEIWLVNFELHNARGVGHYYGGILPDCHVVEDLNVALGDRREKLLAAALAYFERGACDGGRRHVDITDHPRFEATSALVVR